ncbi:pseudoazurin [Thalassorhabdomicrobium marinisediminis]|uniref:Pseudoazurin n=1 Tax=Thalassorhabdomicrobium marinisediminis TaxID=2170577 RepID=A0A2T7FWW0_9RHOB|nr:pseudoazurin [Thalassorhabdomicrobium marinisediminis]PVA06634.1 pseudoazurin [Thalassorhabdomicrobium marinisediminis]
MLKTLTASLALGLALTGAAAAENFDVKMLNRGDDGAMVFEPAFLQLAPGDTVTFLATDRGHNAETVPEMIPEGAEGFEGKINEEIVVTFDQEGLYGIRCKPHYAMGMVMTVAVGEIEEAPEDFLEGRIPRGAKQRFEEQLNHL